MHDVPPEFPLYAPQYAAKRHRNKACFPKPHRTALQEFESEQEKSRKALDASGFMDGPASRNRTCI